MGWMKRWSKRIRTLAKQEAVERELDEELAFHLEMQTQQNLRAGMSPEEARRQAVLEFGGVEKFKEEVRETRGLAWLAGMSLDFKLGARMLAKYPAVTLVGGLAIAVGVAVGAVTFEAVNQLIRPALPLPDGGRVVGILNWDAAAVRPERQSLSDLAAWREELTTIDDVGAFRMLERNLVTGDGRGEPVRVAEISASGFQAAGVPPLLGRFLVDEDERPGADPVVVIGYDVWRTRFGGDPGVVGRTVRFGDAPHTVVGVMPEDFGFPLFQSYWVPLRLRAMDYEPRQGPEIFAFGRLAPGASLEEAQAELATLGRRAAADHPDTHEHLRPEVLPYVEALSPVRVRGVLRVGVYSVNLLAVLFLVLLCANVAILVFARTAARESEIVVRNALGAGRRRIILQLFAEALVLGGVAALAGLGIAALGLRWGLGVWEEVQGIRPFWWNAALSLETVLYAGALTVLGALVVGVVPALKVTGREVQSRLKQATGGSSGLRFGGLWTGIIVTQVALTVFLVPIIMAAAMDTADIHNADPGFAAERYLSARLEMDGEAPSGVSAEAFQAEFNARYRVAFRELERRLEAEPSVAGVTYASQLPGGYHERRWIEVDGMDRSDSATDPRVQPASVDPDFFQAFDAPILAGRGLSLGDLQPDRRVVVVNESFVREMLGGRNPIGQRFRYLDIADPGESPASDAEPGPWYEIVGVASELSLTNDPDLPHNAGIYHPVAPEDAYPLHLAMRVRGEPEALAPRLRALATSVDPSLRLYRTLPLDEIRRDLLMTYQFWLQLAMLVGAVLLLLSFAGIYSILSFTVARRTREIGIRVALGADARRIIAGVFSRALAQLGAGVLLGVLLLVGLSGGIRSLRMLGLLAAGVGVMVGVGLLACMVPTRRALRIEPTEALRADG